MRSIAVINQKGGVGKTTTTVNVAAALAESGYRVLVIDMDPQAHATLHVGIECGPAEATIYDVLCNKATLADITRKIEDNLWVASSHIDLAAAEMELSGVEGRELILKDKLAAVEGEYDYVVVDCPPSLGVLTINALAAVDEVILPMQPHFLALHGLSKLLQTIQLVARRLNQKLKLMGVVFCMFDSGTRLAVEVSRDVEKFFEQTHGQAVPWATAQVFAVRIRRNVRLAEAPSFGRSIFNYAPDSNGAIDYRQLASELITRSEARQVKLAAA
ncbi:MAG: AAA family ATPase [Planctomycetales bacterium]